MTEGERKSELRAQLTAARDRTLWLFGQVPEEFLRRRVHNFYSPIGWHFGHIGRTEEWWVICEALGKPCLDEKLSFLLADLPANPKDNRVNIPDRDGITAFLTATRDRVLEALEATPLDPENPFLREGYVWDFALQHECQHQETIAEMLCLIHQRMPIPTIEFPYRWCGQDSARAVALDGGRFTMGSDAWCGYDNEKSAHKVDVAPFILDETPVTAYQWSLFMAEDGYHRPEFWSDAGWQWRATEDATKPEYWIIEEGQFAIVSPAGVRAIHPEEPVGSISWHEAKAFARWAGQRLPTEEEWELAAVAGSHSRRFPWGDRVPSPELASYGLADWGPRPAASYPANPNGLQGMAGGLWEWTSTPFLPYSGFEAFPYDGYSADHMKGEHRVCRGGSFATAGPILRGSFRNWYVPTYRQGFLGLRCAQ